MDENEEKMRKNEENESDIARARAKDKPKKARVFTRKLTDNYDEIKQMLENAVCITDIAKKFGVCRHTAEDYIHQTEHLEKAYKDGISALTDKYEARLHELAFREQEMVTTDQGDLVGRHDGKVMATNFNAVKFWLQQRAADRGYGAKIETNEVGNGRIPIIIAGDITEDEIAAAEEQVKSANAAAKVSDQSTEG